MKRLRYVFVLVPALASAGCADTDAREALLDGLYAAGKIAYDSLKGIEPPGRH